MRDHRWMGAVRLGLAALGLAMAVGAGACSRAGADSGTVGTDSNVPGSDGTLPGTDATNTDAGGATCTPVMMQMVCAESPGGYGVIVQFDINVMNGSENAPIDQVAIQVDIGGAMFAMPFLDPMPAAGPLTFPRMLGLDICSPNYGAATVTVEGRVAGTAVATFTGMTIPDAAPCTVVMADVNLEPIANICGNGVVDGAPVEDCDGNSLDCVGAGCAGAMGGVATCDSLCMWDCTACT